MKVEINLIVLRCIFILSLSLIIIHTSRVPVEGESSVCLKKYRIIILIIIIMSLGQILLSYIVNTSRMHAHIHARMHTFTHAHTHRRRRRSDYCYSMVPPTVKVRSRWRQWLSVLHST